MNLDSILENSKTYRDKLLVVAYGGGVNSGALLYILWKLGIRPAMILFADTGGERPEVYEAIKHVNAWLKSVGFPEIMTVRKTYQGKAETLEHNCERMKMLPSIAYGFKGCSLKYKKEPQELFLNQWGPSQFLWANGKKITKLIGYDAGEERRAGIREDDKYIYRYPLIEWGLFREDCEALCREAGFPIVKSACFFCPSMKKPEILEMAEKHPELMARAIQMEERAELITVKGLGRRFSWKEFLEADAEKRKELTEREIPEVPCGCYDG